MLVDDREPPSVARRLEASGLFSAVNTIRLSVGDIAFTVDGPNSGTVRVERKTWSDLIHSIRRKQGSGTESHLSYQMRAMRGTLSIPVLLLDGCQELSAGGGLELPDGKIVSKGGFYHADNALLSIQHFGILLVHCLNSEELGLRLAHLGVWLGRSNHTFGNGSINRA